MSVVLYKKGDQVNMDGLGCNMLIVAPELFNAKQLPEGWFLTPIDAHRDTEEEAVEKNRLRLAGQQKAIDDSFKESEEIEEANDAWGITEPIIEEVVEVVKGPGKALKGNAKIRNDAKEAGITDWKTARTATLEKKLKA